MKNKRLTALLLSAGLGALAPSTAAAPPSTAFTYQGLLAENGSPTSGLTSMSFKLWDAVAGGNQVGSTLSSTVDVVDGVFSESLDFGAESYADNQALWLEILVEGQSLGRTPISATPFALNTRGISVDENGRVGIGTDSPASSLQIFTPNWGNDIRFRDDNSTLIQLRAGGDQGSSMNFSDQGGSRYLGYIGFEENAGYTLDSASHSGNLSNALFVNGANGQIGIGTDNSEYKVHINDGPTDTSVALLMLDADLGPQVAMHYRSTGGWYTSGIRSNGDFYIEDQFSSMFDAPAFLIQKSTGRVGIGPMATNPGPQDTLHVAGSIRVDSGMRIGQTGFSNVALNIDRALDFGINLSRGDAGKPGGGSWANTSDIRLKKNITPIEGALDTLLDLRGVHFEYKDPKGIGELEGVRTGFIAQEVEKVISDWVWDAQDGYKRITVRGFEAMTVEAMRELKAENDDLRERVEALEAMVHAMLSGE